MTSMLRYCFSLMWVVFPLLLSAQNSSVPQPVDSVQISYPQRYGLRIGTDLYKASRNIWDKNYKGFEITADYRWNKNIYIAAEIGSDKRFKEDYQLSYTTKGNYLKIGADYNLHNNWMDLENMIYVGGRYGISFHSQTLHSYKIFSSDPYFGENELYPNVESTGLTAHWIDVVGGFKTRVFNNVFMGISVRFSYLIAQKQPEGFENLFIPGYGEKFSGNIGATFNYTVSYFIPLYKKKPQIELPKTKAPQPGLN